MNEIKLVGYILAAVGLLSLFFSALLPALLHAPPTGLLLPAVVLIMAAMLYILTFGPVWILHRIAEAHAGIRYQLNVAMSVLSLVWVFCMALPVVPAVADVPTASFAAAAILLRAVAGEDDTVPPNGEGIIG